MRKQVLSLLVENTSGVLSHISGLFSRRGYNIDSFSAGVTADPRFTRITVVSSGDEQILEQIEKQLNKKLDELKKDLFMLRMQHATNQLDNPMQIAAVKKDIARIKTIIREKETNI